MRSLSRPKDWVSTCQISNQPLFVNGQSFDAHVVASRGMEKASLLLARTTTTGTCRASIPCECTPNQGSVYCRTEIKILNQPVQIGSKIKYSKKEKVSPEKISNIRLSKHERKFVEDIS